MHAHTCTHARTHTHTHRVYAVFVHDHTSCQPVSLLQLFCRLVAISLHYFYMAAFAWLYVEVLHIYRMLTEKQTINYGTMKFYYLLGYGEHVTLSSCGSVLEIGSFTCVKL